MRPLPDMQAEILDRMPLLDEVEVDWSEAVGGVLARPIDAPEDLPGFENAAMDGFAVIAADTQSTPVELSVIDDVPAGCVPSVAVAKGTVVRIMTGAQIPDGADAIVPVEATEPVGDDSVRILEGASVADHIRPAGGSVREGTRVFDPGLRLRPTHVAVLASMGVRPIIRRRPIVAVMSTGNELVSPATPSLEAGTIRDSNRTLVAALIADLGADVIDYGIVSDNGAAFEQVIDDAALRADVIITSGGVSMGAYDVVKLSLRERADVDFWKIAMQPGKPFGFGMIGETVFFGLPGNPVSVFVSYEQFVRPALLAMMGADLLYRERVEGVLDDGVVTNPEKAVFVRVAGGPGTDGRWHVSRSGGQSSNVLSALALADALAAIPVGVGEVAAGGTVALEMIHRPETRTRREVLGDR
ncbi:MAG: gephyrin-like molybdotransferase Glp [Actinomycetota bacterium]